MQERKKYFAKFNGVLGRTESDGAANLIQKLRAINYALGELGQWCAFKNDERANYQLDVKFQESYLGKVALLLQCHLSEGAADDKNVKLMGPESGFTEDRTDEI